MEFGSALLTGAIGGFLGAGTKEFISWLFNEVSRKHAELDKIQEILTSTILEIGDLANNYWSKSSSSKGALVSEGKILGRLHYCGKLYPELFRDSLNEKRLVDTKLVRLRKAITGGEFGSKYRNANTGKIAEMEIAAFELLSQIKLGRIRSRKRIKFLQKA